MKSERIALYGGSFDPPHLGHVLSVAWALSATEVDQVWVIPTWKHAFDKEHGASFEARFAMCELAFAPFHQVEVSSVEQRLGGVSRTLGTIQALKAEHPGASFRLLIGADVLGSTDRWHRWDEIIQAAPALIVGREGYPAPEGCPISIPDISSTDIRDRIAGADSLSGLVPASVVGHIRGHGLYPGPR